MNITRKELANLYGVCELTISRRLKQIGITHRLGITSIEQYLFKKTYGEPVKRRNGNLVLE